MMKRVAMIVCFTAVACSRLLAHLATVDEQTHALDAIHRHVNATMPWWTCECLLNLLRRDGDVLVYRVIFCGKQKCSRSHRNEYFEASYDVGKNKIIQM